MSARHVIEDVEAAFSLKCGAEVLLEDTWLSLAKPVEFLPAQGHQERVMPDRRPHDRRGGVS